MIVQIVPRRNGRPPGGSVFGPLPVPTLSYPNNYGTMRPPYLGGGVSYDPHPMAVQHRVATGVILPHTVQKLGLQFAPNLAPQLGPHERTNWMVRKQMPLVKRVGGPSPVSDTPFHPAMRKLPPQTLPAKPVVRHVTRGNTLSSFDMTRNRWAVVKRGAAG